jgi:SAM-dependent methyltransferase
MRKSGTACRSRQLFGLYFGPGLSGRRSTELDPELLQRLEKLQIIAHERTHHRVLDLFKEFGGQGKVLEIPAGEGALAWRLSRMGYEVIGGDVDPAFFKVPFLKCLYLDMNRNFPVEDGAFDYISCIEGIEHLEDHFGFIRECQRVLRPKGRLILSTPNILNIASRMKYLLSGFYSLCPRPINEFSTVPVFDHINPVTYYQLRYMLHTNGFRITQTCTDFYRRSCYGLIFLYPFMRMAMLRTMRKETNERQRAANREIRKVMASLNLFLGRTLIVVAIKRQKPQIVPTTLASSMT